MLTDKRQMASVCRGFYQCDAQDTIEPTEPFSCKFKKFVFYNWMDCMLISYPKGNKII